MDNLFSSFKFEEVNDTPLNDFDDDHDGVRDIAVIGMSVKLSHADQLSQFWDIIASGKDMITEFPDNRKKDIDDYLTYMNLINKDSAYKKGGLYTRH